MCKQFVSCDCKCQVQLGKVEDTLVYEHFGCKCQCRTATDERSVLVVRVCWSVLNVGCYELNLQVYIALSASHSIAFSFPDASISEE